MSGDDNCDQKAEPTIERLLIGDIVYEQDTHSTAIVSSRDGSESLLTRSVPLEDIQREPSAGKWAGQNDPTHDLKFYSLAIQFYGSNLEVDTDSRDERGGPRIVAESQ